MRPANKQELFTEFSSIIPGTTASDFQQILARDALREVVRKSHPELLNRLASALAYSAGDNESPARHEWRAAEVISRMLQNLA